jgi:DNA modification methylase
VVVPWLDDGDVKLFHGDAAEVLAQLPAASVQTCVTSPPYWGLRDYGTGEWAGGSDECDHVRAAAQTKNLAASVHSTRGGAKKVADTPDLLFADVCGRCGARRVDAQLGLEPSPRLYVRRLVAVFREVRRVLRDDGTLWLNLGDSYTSGLEGGRNDGGRSIPRSGQGGKSGTKASVVPRDQRTKPKWQHGLKPKDLVGIPWRVAFALQEDGWYLRSDIIWSKPNPMPESVTDRPTKAHEYLFMLSKRPKYYWDADAIREPAEPWNSANGFNAEGQARRNIEGRIGARVDQVQTGRNARSVWAIATQPTAEAHFATMPEELARRCILAGTSEAGECSVCAAPWMRQVERTRYEPPGAADGERFVDASRGDKTRKLSGAAYNAQVRVTGESWAASCACDAPTRPQTVLDPFAGSGTTALVARHHARHAIGIDLSAEYLAIAARRLQQLSLLV